MTSIYKCSVTTSEYELVPQGLDQYWMVGLVNCSWIQTHQVTFFHLETLKFVRNHKLFVKFETLPVHPSQILHDQPQEYY